MCVSSHSGPTVESTVTRSRVQGNHTGRGDEDFTGRHSVVARDKYFFPAPTSDGPRTQDCKKTPKMRSSSSRRMKDEEPSPPETIQRQQPAWNETTGQLSKEQNALLLPGHTEERRRDDGKHVQDQCMRCESI